MIQIQIQKSLLMAEGKLNLDVDFRLEMGSFCTLYGKSGAGKTTILKILAGLVQPDAGFIQVNDQVWLDTAKNINLAPQKRNIGFVFQDYALFPNMTVRENLVYAAQSKEDLSAIDDLLQRASLLSLADRKPLTLSGGQQQRVALVRALVRKPPILLLDEPLSALDLEMRQLLQDQIYQLHKSFGTTTLLVSHQLSEIYRLSDQIISLDKGKVIAQGPPAEIFGKERLSSKIQLVGEVLAIKKSDVIYILDVLIGNNIIKTVATEDEVTNLQPGDTVTVFTKAFNPIIKKR
ncbi:ATP-binding cassette domain-containing protein [Adhaeribacter aquaticus]|uniref:ATP-binding cassette domain-containing protein n=1 Tax=Adhaeribacter aquaticus TaxID=299567 RepID=UPI00040F41CE|nr:ATP-binding cassette domain-containing protein [Adhaeribacter aquaticus]